MKKILEVLQYGENDIRFNTDIDVSKNPNAVMDVVLSTSFAMTTTLWGGNEISVLAMIRALAIADLGVSVNRKDMIRFLDESSKNINLALKDATNEFKKNGGKIKVFQPGIIPPKTRS